MVLWTDGKVYGMLKDGLQLWRAKGWVGFQLMSEVGWECWKAASSAAYFVSLRAIRPIAA